MNRSPTKKASIFLRVVIAVITPVCGDIVAARHCWAQAFLTNTQTTNPAPANKQNTDPSATDSATMDAAKQNNATLDPRNTRSSEAIGLEATVLELSDVIASTYRAFPLLEIARLEAGVAQGQQTSSYGAYDTKLEYYSLNQPVGYYETFRQGIGIARQLWWGGYTSAGYRIGRGSFEPWYKERQTNDGGEFKIAWTQPLLQGRAIDPYRVELFQSNLKRQAVGPEIQHQLLSAGQDAARAYWYWVGAGNVLKAQMRLFEIATQRGQQIEKSFAADSASRLDLAQNAQQIYDRQFKVNEVRQKFLDAAFKLSLFLRDERGNPMLAPPEWLPKDFPELADFPTPVFESDMQLAMANRPELKLIDLEAKSLRWDLSLAQNQLLPNVDLTVQSVQNVGERASSINDKGEFQLEAGVMGGVPIQRRKATGKIQGTQAKLAQLSQKYQFQLNKIEVELRSYRNALEQSQANVKTAKNLLEQTNLALSAFQKARDAGKVDLFFLLQQEVKVNEAEVKLLDAERDLLVSIAMMQAALALDPLEQAMNLSVP